MKVLIIQKGVFKEMAAKFSRFSELCFLICQQVVSKDWSMLEAENRPYWIASYMIPHVEQYTTSPNTTV